ncbi:MAG: hypothetical protein ACJ79C_18745 [Myxococcales bacterium]
MGRISTQHLVLVTGLGLVVSAAPQARPAPVARIATHHSASRRTRAVSFAALFDTETTFKAKATVELRFRAREAISGDPIRDRDISFHLRRGADGASIPLPAAEVRKGVFAVPFTPPGPGDYWLAAAVRGAPSGTIPEIRLGVLGLAEGAVEVQPEDGNVKAVT